MSKESRSQRYAKNKTVNASVPAGTYQAVITSFAKLGGRILTDADGAKRVLPDGFQLVVALNGEHVVPRQVYAPYFRTVADAVGHALEVLGAEERWLTVDYALLADLLTDAVEAGVAFPVYYGPTEGHDAPQLCFGTKKTQG